MAGKRETEPRVQVEGVYEERQGTQLQWPKLLLKSAVVESLMVDSV